MFSITKRRALAAYVFYLNFAAPSYWLSLPPPVYTSETTTRLALRLPVSTTPWWLWPNIISLDAPAIASLWQNLAAKDAGLTLSAATRFALPLSVWLVYLADRLFDSLHSPGVAAPARHVFYRNHRKIGVALLIVAAVSLSASLLSLTQAVLHKGLLLSAFVAAYLLAVHTLPLPWRRYLPKELAVAAIFSAGTLLPVWGRSMLLPGLLFGLTCWLNCSVIEVWERRGHQPSAATGWLVRQLTPGSLAIAASSLLLLPLSSFHLLLAGIFCCSLAFCWLNRVRASFNQAELRVLADLPLFITALLLGLG